MTSLATKADWRTDRARKVRPRAAYSPPSFHEISLLDALKGTGRSLDAKQLNLLQIDDAPSYSNDDVDLFYAGKISLLKKPCVAVVGTRAISDAGTLRTRRLARELVEAGIVVVSGLAVGVDTVALTTAIENGGDTVAVIGTPLDKAYPAENAPLQEEIYKHHLLISQFAAGTKTYRSSFPQRNKLMAALSDATVVMEASDTSGTVHQAAECTRLGRWLFIAKSVVEDRNLNWPKKFLKYPTCIPLEHVSQITDRIKK
jgi:DNA processing protein